VVAYLPNLRSVVRHFRAFSSYDENKPANEYPELDIADGMYCNTENILWYVCLCDTKFCTQGMFWVMLKLMCNILLFFLNVCSVQSKYFKCWHHLYEIKLTPEVNLS